MTSSVCDPHLLYNQNVKIPSCLTFQVCQIPTMGELYNHWPNQLVKVVKHNHHQTCGHAKKEISIGKTIHVEGFTCLYFCLKKIKFYFSPRNFS